MQKDVKPQIYNEILHYSNDNNQYQRSKYHQMNNFGKNGNKTNKKSRKRSMTELSDGY